MLSKNQLKYYTSLKHKKFRKENNSFLAEGDKIVMELLSDPGFFQLKSLLALPSFLEQAELISNKLNIIELTNKELERISSLTTPNRAVLEIEIPDYNWSYKEISGSISFYYENIQDPGNLGTIIRTADWFGIQNIFCSPGSADAFNPKVIQATMGSISRVKVHYEEPDVFFGMNNDLPNDFQSFATVLNGESIYNSEMPGKGIIFFGNESSGLRENIVQRCKKRISIPGDPLRSGAESLNLSIATGIVSAEILRWKLTRNES